MKQTQKLSQNIKISNFAKKLIFHFAQVVFQILAKQTVIEKSSEPSWSFKTQLITCMIPKFEENIE